MKNNNYTFGKWYDSMMLILILYVLTEISLEVILPISQKNLLILSWIDFGICVLFLADWIYFFVVAEKKGAYVKSRFIDLISSIPFIQVLRPLRLLRFVRLIRGLRMIRGLKGAIPLFRIIFKNPLRSALSVYLFLTMIIFAYCTVGLYNFEVGINNELDGLDDVIWMGFTTLTTVGYGDLYPITQGGRIMAGILVMTGMGLFGLLTAEIAAVLLEKIQKTPD